MVQDLTDFSIDVSELLHVPFVLLCPERDSFGVFFHFKLNPFASFPGEVCNDYVILLLAFVEGINILLRVILLEVFHLLLLEFFPNRHECAVTLSDDNRTKDECIFKR